MPIYQLKFVCRTCQDINKQNLGTDKFELKQTDFESLTGAMEHMLESKENQYSIAHELEPEIIEQ